MRFPNLHTFLAFVIATIALSTATQAGPGDYSLRVKAGPSFSLADWENQARVGGEFDYDMGDGLGFNLMAQVGISNNFRFDLIPSIRYDYLYIGPAAFYAAAGMGYGVFDKQSALDVRIATGLMLPLGESFEFSTDVNLFFAPVGTPGTPVTLDWLIGFGYRYH